MTIAKRIQIFKPGTFTPMSGGEVSFTENDVAAIADSYDQRTFSAPVVVGHPSIDAPAYGWVKGLAFAEGHLVAELDQVDPEFAEAVSAGRYKKVSAAFYGPENKSNPKPGGYYLKHVGFLGGAAPAVKGLKSVTEPAFSEPADLVVELGETEDNVRMISELFSRLRDLILEQFGREEAESALPKGQVDWLHERAVRAADKSAEDAQSNFSERSADGDAKTPSPNIPTPTIEDSKVTEDDLNARAESLSKREAELRRSEDKAFVESLAREGKPLAGRAGDQALAFMATLDDTKTLEFAEGEEAQSQLSAFKGFLSNLPKVVEFGEVDKGQEPEEAAQIAFAAPDGMNVDQGGLAVHSKAIAYQAEHPGTEYMDAVRAVGGR